MAGFSPVGTAPTAATRPTGAYSFSLPQGNYVLTLYADRVDYFNFQLPVGNNFPLLSGGELTFLGAKRGMLLPTGVFTLAGGALKANGSYPFVSPLGTFVLAGNALKTVRARQGRLPAGVFAFTGYAVKIVHSYPMAQAKGTYALVGGDQTGLAGFSFPLPTARYALKGGALKIATGRILAQPAGAYALGGNPVSIRARRTFVLGSSGFYNLNTAPVAAQRNRVLPLATRFFPLTGHPIEIAIFRSVKSVQGSYTLTFKPIASVRARTMSQSAGTYALVGKPLQVALRFQSAPQAGAYHVTGQPISIARSRKMILSRGSFNLFASDFNLSYQDENAIIFAAFDYPLVGALPYTVESPVNGLDLDPGSYTLTAGSMFLSKTMLLADAAYALAGNGLGMQRA